MTTTDTHALDPWTELERAGRVAPVSEDVLLAARVAVRRAATTETLRAKVGQVRRRRLRRTAIALAASAAVVAAGAVTVRVGGHDVSGSPASAAAVFERAARAALAQHDPVVPPGHYLKVTLVQQSWGASYGRGNTVLVGRDGRPATYEERWTRTIWIPHDVDADWTFRERTRVMRNGTTDPAYQDVAEPGRTWRQRSESRPGKGTYLKTYDPDWYASLPRDPAKLLRAIRAQVGGEGSSAAYDFAEIYSEVLRSGLAPAAVRSAVFSALAKAPDMVVAQGVQTLDGRAGIAIGARGGRYQMIFDAKTGRFVGERNTDPDFPGVPGLDADKTTLLTSVTTTVVDSAPRARREVSR